MTFNVRRFLFRKAPGKVIARRSRFTGTFIGSPSLCRLSATHYIVSHDLFGPKSAEFDLPTTYIYETKDAGVTWSQLSIIKGAFWSRLFFHEGFIYLFGTNRHHGDLVIRRSVDSGVTWTEPKDEKTGLLQAGMFHMAPTPIVVSKDSLYFAIELADGPLRQWGKRYGACIASVPADVDILDASGWKYSNVLYYDAHYLQGCFGGWLEGNVVRGLDGAIKLLLRVEGDCSFDEKAALITFDSSKELLSFNPEADFVPFPGGSKKFYILFDVKTGLYISLSNSIQPSERNIYEKSPDQVRNRVSLMASKDLKIWEEKKVILESEDEERTAFQYLSFAFDGQDIIFVSRTAGPDGTFGARSYHDANLLTFHRIKNFRLYLV